MDYQQAAVPVPGTDAWQPQLASLRAVAAGVLNSHVNNRGRCAVCGSDWPFTQQCQTNHGALGGDMTMQWPLRNSLQLGALPTAAPCARLHAKHLLWEWGLEAIADTAELLVSELVTNGIQAAQAAEQRPPVWLRLSANNAHAQRVASAKAMDNLLTLRRVRDKLRKLAYLTSVIPARIGGVS